MAARRKPALKSKPKKSTKKPAPKRRPATKKHLLPTPASREAALAWFANLSTRISDAGVPELKALIAEARTYDLVGLEEVLGDHTQVLQLNEAANQLIEAGLDTFGAASPQGFELQVLRDILNDS